MIEKPGNTDKLNPKTPSDEEPEIIDGDEEIIEDEQNTGIDPLAALRQDMFEEEQTPAPLNRPDLLHRMTGTLGSRKVPTRPRPATTNEQSFGIRTNRNMPPPEPPVRASQAPNEEFRDEFLEKRLRTGPLNAPTNKPNQETPPDSPIHIEGDPKAEGGLFTQSPVSDYRPGSFTETRGRRRMDPLWDNADEEVEESQEISSPKGTEISGRPAEERKMLGTGTERQYQVNKFLSYNPKRNWFERYQELSIVEKILLVLLVIAVIVVTGLIVYLYAGSRQIYLPQVQPPFSNTQVIEPTSTEKIPVPSSLRLTGGWSFQLNQGELKDGKWLPVSSEWLNGTEIRKVIALPWNRQLEAVINSLEPNNSIELYMTNGDILTYKVLSIAQVPVSDSSVMYDTRSSLAIILINPGSTSRWVVIAYP